MFQEVLTCSVLHSNSALLNMVHLADLSGLEGTNSKVNMFPLVLGLPLMSIRLKGAVQWFHDLKCY